MGRLAVLIAGFFGSIFTWITGFFTAKVATSAIVVIVTGGTIMVMFYCLREFVQGIVSLVDNEIFRMVFWAIWPFNAEACLAACWGADICVFLYRYRRK
jgi:hypothetical protein